MLLSMGRIRYRNLYDFIRELILLRFNFNKYETFYNFVNFSDPIGFGYNCCLFVHLSKEAK